MGWSTPPKTRGSVESCAEGLTPEFSRPRAPRTPSPRSANAVAALSHPSIATIYALEDATARCAWFRNSCAGEPPRRTPVADRCRAPPARDAAGWPLPTVSPRRTTAASSIAISSRRTSSVGPTARSRCSTGLARTAGGTYDAHQIDDGGYGDRTRGTGARTSVWRHHRRADRHLRLRRRRGNWPPAVIPSHLGQRNGRRRRSSRWCGGASMRSPISAIVPALRSRRRCAKYRQGDARRLPAIPLGGGASRRRHRNRSFRDARDRCFARSTGARPLAPGSFPSLSRWRLFRSRSV